MNAAMTARWKGLIATRNHTNLKYFGRVCGDMRFIALGNELKGDDGVGIYAGKKLKKLGFSVVFGYTNPEAVVRALPEGELYFLDAAMFEGEKSFVVGKPGGHGLSTHNYPISLISKYMGREIKVIGIKTYSNDFGYGISEKAKRNADLAVEYVLGLSGKGEVS